MPVPPKAPRELAIACWSMVGVAALLIQALWKLTPRALEPILDHSLTPPQVFAYAAWVTFNAYAEGYRGFHKAWSPRVVARTWHVARQPRLLHVLFAPLFAMSLIHATRRRLLISWVLLASIAAVVVMMRYVPQPYRGIVDGGVVVGLGIGLSSLLLHFARSLQGFVPESKVDIPAA